MRCKEGRAFLEKVKGETINSIFISEDVAFLKTNHGCYKFEVEGDCCSHSYFYEVNNVWQMVGFKIVEIVQVDLPEVAASDYKEFDEHVQAYCYKIITTGGYGLFIFRNSSNGYYGGHINYLGETELGIEQTKEIWEDWNL